MFERLNAPACLKVISRTDVDPEKLLRRLSEQEAEADALADAADRLPVKVYVAKADALAAKAERIKAKLTAATPIAATAWVGKADKLRTAWDKLTTDEQREIMLSVVGQFDVLPPERMGRYATRKRVKARLRPRH